jgi:hypothetical protein
MGGIKRGSLASYLGPKILKGSFETKGGWSQVNENFGDGP